MQNTNQVEMNPGLDAGLMARAEADRLKREHNELKTRLAALNDRLYLSPAEEVEKKTLQKLKLAKKDRIAELESLMR